MQHWYSTRSFEGCDGSQEVRKRILSVQDGGRRIALLRLALDTAHNLRSCCLAFKICAVQVSCR